jgi:hypothetical protein
MGESTVRAWTAWREHGRKTLQLGRGHERQEVREPGCEWMGEIAGRSERGLEGMQWEVCEGKGGQLSEMKWTLLSRLLLI